MPIRPEMKSRYPANWKEIRERILARAGQRRNASGLITREARCERCGLLNHSIGQRNKDGTFYMMEGMESEVASLEGEKVVRIVLTIAHIHDPAPENCADHNLQALCQRCHNTLDAPLRAANRKARREAARLTREPRLF